MGRKRLSEDGHKLTNIELQHRHIDSEASIDSQMQEAFDGINYERKEFASKSLRNFIDSYMIDFVLESKPSEKTYEVIDDLERALKDCKPVQIQLSRGAGKTTLASIAILYLISLGIRKFCVIVSQNARSASNILKDIFRMIVEESAFSQDFPEIAKPFQIANGCYRRRQTFRGVQTNLQKNSNCLVFARLQDEYGNEMPTSGAAITVRGITSGIRGLKLPNPTGRPDCVLLDDLLDASSAASPEQNEKILDIIKKDIFNLSSGKKLGVCMTSTPLLPEDLTDKISNDPNWKTIKYPAIIRYPDDIVNNPDDGLWHQYFRIYDDENANDESHEKSLKFYSDNFDKMNEGSQIFQNRFKESDGHISGLQALLEKKHIIGNAAFQAEMQLQPLKISYSLDITPNKVLQSMNSYCELEVPDGFTYVVCSIDLNVSFAMTYVITAFKPDLTAVVIYHGIYKCNIDQKLSDTSYNQQVYNHLTLLCKQICGFGIKIDAVAIDAGGRNWDAVCDFSKNSYNLVKLRCCAFAGRASHLFNTYVKTRLRDAMGRTVLCGDAREQIKSGSGNKYVLFDSDFYRETVQRGFLNSVGSAGSISLYQDDSSQHTEFAIQITNERLRFIHHKQDGRNVYTWKSKDPHDYLDCMSMCFAVAAQSGIGAMNFKRDYVQKRNTPVRHKPRIRIV